MRLRPHAGSADRCRQRFPDLRRGHDRPPAGDRPRCHRYRCRAACGRLGIGPGAHFLIEHAVPQRLHSIDFGRPAAIRTPSLPLRSSAKGPPASRGSVTVAHLAHRLAPLSGRGAADRGRHRVGVPCCIPIGVVIVCRFGAHRFGGSQAIRICVAPDAPSSRRRPNSSSRRETTSKPRRAAIACIRRSCSGSWNSMTLPVSTSIRW